MSGYTLIDNDKILDNEDFSIQEQSLYIAILSYHNEEKGCSYPSYKKLKQRSKIKKDETLIKTLKSLIEKGYVKKETLKGTGNKYYIVTPKTEYPQKQSTSKNGGTPTPKREEHLPQKRSTTNTNTNTNTNNNNKKGYDAILNSYTENQTLKDTLLEFVKMRKTIKKPMTDRALSLLLKKLDNLTNIEENKIKIVEQSILNSWQGIFPLKDSIPQYEESINSKDIGSQTKYKFLE